MTAPEHETAIQLAREWDAMAASIEKDRLSGMWIGQDSRTLRWCACQLRGRFGVTEQRTEYGEQQ